MTKQVMMLLAVFSLSGCAGQSIQNCIINAENLNRKCYDLSTDYNDDGTLKGSAKPVYKDNKSLQDVDKALVIDSSTGFEDGLAHLKAYIKNLREKYQNCNAGDI